MICICRLQSLSSFLSLLPPRFFFFYKEERWGWMCSSNAAEILSKFQTEWELASLLAETCLASQWRGSFSVHRVPPTHWTPAETALVWTTRKHGLYYATCIFNTPLSSRAVSKSILERDHACKPSSFAPLRSVNYALQQWCYINAVSV